MATKEPNINLIAAYIAVCILVVAFSAIGFSIGSRMLTAANDSQNTFGVLTLIGTLAFDIIGASLLYKGFSHAIRA